MIVDNPTDTIEDVMPLECDNLDRENSRDETVETIAACAQPSAADQPFQSPSQLLFMAILPYGVLICVSWGLGRAPVNAPNPPSAEWFRFSPGLFAISIAATLPLVLLMLLIDHDPFGWFGKLNQVIDQEVVPLFRGCRWWQFALLASLAGVGEEFFFRWLVQSWLFYLLADAWAPAVAAAIALIGSSIIFGLMHPLSSMYVALAFCISLYLGSLYLVTGSLLAPMIVHALYDFIALAYMKMVRSD